MRTLYLQNVPDDVVERLERIADRADISVGDLAVRELTASSRRTDAPVVVAAPEAPSERSDVLADLQAARVDGQVDR